jgi:hypothetical protein
MDNKEKLMKRFNELCDIISQGDMSENDSKAGYAKNKPSTGKVLNELKIIDIALRMADGKVGFDR